MKTLAWLLGIVISFLLMIPATPPNQSEQIPEGDEICDCYKSQRKAGRWTISPATGMKIWIPQKWEKVKQPCAKNLLLFDRKHIS